MAGGKGKSTGGKAGPKESPPHKQKSHSAKAGLQVSTRPLSLLISHIYQWWARPRHLDPSQSRTVALSPLDVMSQAACTTPRLLCMGIKDAPQLTARCLRVFQMKPAA